MTPTLDPTADNLRLAYERTTLSWTRTALSFIGFGFTIDKFLENKGGRPIGITMIAIGLLSLLLFVVELRQFHKAHPEMPRSLAGFVAGMMGILGIVAFIVALAT